MFQVHYQGQKQSKNKKETPAICTKLHNLPDAWKPQAYSPIGASVTAEQLKQLSV